MIRIATIVCILFICSTGFLHSSPPLPRLGPDEIEGAKIKPAEVYAGESLFGFMNGGAELYLEYGFDSLAVQKITVGASEYQSIVYKMSDSAAAYGIHSVTRHQQKAFDQENAFTYKR